MQYSHETGIVPVVSQPEKNRVRIAEHPVEKDMWVGRTMNHVGPAPFA